MPLSMCSVPFFQGERPLSVGLRRGVRATARGASKSMGRVSAQSRSRPLPALRFPGPAQNQGTGCRTPPIQGLCPQQRQAANRSRAAYSHVSYCHCCTGGVTRHRPFAVPRYPASACPALPAWHDASRGGPGRRSTRTGSPELSARTLQSGPATSRTGFRSRRG